MQKRIKEHKKNIYIFASFLFHTKKSRKISKISLTLTNNKPNWTIIVSQESVISDETEETNTGFDTNYFGTLQG